jgi:hypothetical protein
MCFFFPQTFFFPTLLQLFNPIWLLHQCSVCDDPALEILDEVHKWWNPLEDLLGPFERERVLKEPAWDQSQ